MLSYGLKTGLAYRHNTLEWEQERNRQEQLDKQDEQARMQKADWLSQQMTIGKTYTDYDRNGLQNWAHQEVLPKIARLMREPGAWTNANRLAEVRMLSESLKENEWTQRSMRVQQQYELMLKTLNDPNYANDDDARQEILNQMNEYANYNKLGNRAGIENGQIDEFSFRPPQLFDFDQYANENAKTLGTREKIYTANGMLHNEQYFANIDDRVKTMLSGKDAAKLERTWQKARSNGVAWKTKEDWLKYELSIRKDLNHSASMLPQSGNGDGNNLSPYNYFGETIFRTVQEMAALSKQANGKRIQKSLAGDDLFLLGQGVNQSPDGKLLFSVGPNQNVLVPKKNGGAVEIASLSGKQLEIIPTNYLVHENGSTYYKAFATMGVDENSNTEIKDNLLTGGGLFDDDWTPNPELEGVELKTTDSADDYEAIKFPVLIPVSLSDPTVQHALNQSNTGAANATEVGQYNQQVRYGNNMIQLAKNAAVGEVLNLGQQSYKKISSTKMQIVGTNTIVDLP